MNDGGPQDPWRLVAWARQSGAIRAAVLDWLDMEVQERRAQLGVVSPEAWGRLRAEIGGVLALRGRIVNADHA